ncbi:MAG: type II toxin-antitoxin system RelE/ParE family toxin [Flavobacteriales bacterium]|nr:type II toxin-antitoxin system RelE/ParE family toxin [Flavobacteriales bacterium]
MVKVTWSARARKDLDGISAYIAEGSAYYAERTELEIFQRSLFLEAHPKAGRMVKEVGDASIREIGYGRYRIIHWLVSDVEVVIIAVVHGSRKLTPGTVLARRRK